MKHGSKLYLKHALIYVKSYMYTLYGCVVYFKLRYAIKFAL